MVVRRQKEAPSLSQSFKPGFQPSDRLWLVFPARRSHLFPILSSEAVSFRWTRHPGEKSLPRFKALGPRHLSRAALISRRASVPEQPGTPSKTLIRMNLERDEHHIHSFGHHNLHWLRREVKAEATQVLVV